MAKEIPADELAARRLARERAVKEAKRRLKQEANDEADLSEKQLNNKLCMEVADLIAGGVLGFKCHIYEDKHGVRKPLIEDENRQVLFIDPEKIISSIYQYVKSKSEFDHRYLWSMREVESCYTMWKSGSTVLTDIKTFDWLSGSGLTFRRLPFDYVEKDDYECPLWKRILDNIETGKDHFIDYIGSIFVQQSYRQQYMWMQGSGGDGKGTLIACLQGLLGGDNCVRVKEDLDDKFWAENLESARVAFFSDVKNTSLPTHQLFIDITGSNTITIEKKGLSKFTVKNNLKFIFASNYLPTIQNINRDQRRGIVVTFKRKEKADISNPKAFDDEAEAQFPEFISMCVKSYKKNYPKFGQFEIDEKSSELMGNIGAETDLSFQMIIDQFFEIEKVEIEQKFSGQELLKYLVKDTRLTAYLEEAKVPKKDMFAIRRWLGSRWGVYISNTETKEYGKGNYYKGIREKYPDFSFSDFNVYRRGTAKIPKSEGS